MMTVIERSIFFVAMVLLSVTAMRAQMTADIRTVVEARLKDAIPRGGLTARCAIYEDWVAARVFTEYGAMYLAEKPIVVPSHCIVEGDAELSAMQAFMNGSTANIGGVAVTLQKPALDAFLEARAAAARAGIAITPRGGSIASTRSYDDTVRLWGTRFEPALAYWIRKGRIKKVDADAVRKAPIRKQIEAVLTWEQEGMWFSKDLSKSIVYSVAIPGASQHNFMLAIDIEQFQNPRVRQILADHGWFQTVKSDLPHFTYLGLKETDLGNNGLSPVTVGGQKFWIPNVSNVK